MIITLPGDPLELIGVVALSVIAGTVTYFVTMALAMFTMDTWLGSKFAVMALPLSFVAAVLMAVLLLPKLGG